jgi:hypothetical protein
MFIVQATVVTVINYSCNNVNSTGRGSYLPLEVAIKGLASSESALIATAFLKLFMALPPTLAVLAVLAVKLGLAWLEDTEKKYGGVDFRERETSLEYHYLELMC